MSIVRASTIAELPLRVRRRVAVRVLPYLFVLYVVAFLDRANVSYASLQMSGALGFTPEVYGFGAGVFFLGYLLLEIPGSLAVERWSARKWFARIMVTWGAIAACMALVGASSSVDAAISPQTQFFALRFLLGVAEAGFFPGIVVYLAHWFRSGDRARAIALFMAAAPVSNVVGAPLSGLLLGVHWLGVDGWRWLFVLEGVPAVLLGVATLFVLTDRPEHATWLRDDERAWLVGELASERASVRDHIRSTIAAALADPTVLALSAVYLFIIAGGYGFVYWLPTLVKGSTGFGDLGVTLVCAALYAVALGAMLANGWLADRHGDRALFAAVPMLLAAVGFTVAAVGIQTPALVLAGLCLAGAATHAYLPPFWSIPSQIRSGTTAATAIGLISSLGNVGGFVGSYAIGAITTRTGSQAAGLAFVAALALVAGLLLVAARSRGLRATKSESLSDEG